MKTLFVVTLLAATACIAQNQKQGSVTSIPSTSLDEPTVRTRAGAAPKVAPRFAVSISAPTTSGQAREPNIVVTINNLSDQAIPWSPGYDDVRITVKRGSVESQRTALHRYLRGEPTSEDAPLPTSGSKVTLFIPPHKTASQLLDLGKLYEFKQDGDYTVVVERYDDASDVFVRSNAFTVRYRK